MKRTIFIGQAMPKVFRDPYDWPSLNAWLYSIGMNDESIQKNTKYSALIDYFPGSINGAHIVPTGEDIEKERDRLAITINDYKPEIVVPIGRLSISYCLDQKVQPLINHVGNTYFVNPYLLYDRELLTIPLPHPSGASTWRHNEDNKQLLEKALRLLRENMELSP